MTDFIREAERAITVESDEAKVALRDPFNVSDVLIALGEGRRILSAVLSAFAVFGLLAAVLISPNYQATTLILPPHDRQLYASSLLSGMGGLAGAAGGALGAPTPGELYLGLLQSASIQNDIVDQFDLRSRYRVKTTQDARSRLAKYSVIKNDRKSGLLSVKVSDHDAGVAAALANGYVTNLSKLLDRIAVTDAQQRRDFLEIEVRKSGKALAEAEGQYRKLQAKTGIVSVDADTQLAIRRASEIRAELSGREIELQSMGTYATRQNPEVQRMSAEVAALQAQLDKIEHGDTSKAVNSDAAMATIRLYRRMRYQQASFDALSEKLEAARIDAARDGPLVQQVDVALPPEKRSPPGPALIFLLFIANGLIVGLASVFAHRYIRRRRDDPKVALKRQRLRSAWKSK